MMSPYFSCNGQIRDLGIFVLLGSVAEFRTWAVEAFDLMSLSWALEADVAYFSTQYKSWVRVPAEACGRTPFPYAPAYAIIPKHKKGHYQLHRVPPPDR